MKVAADGKKKFTMLLTKPAKRIPTAAELNAGIDFSCSVLDSDANFTSTASDRFNEKPACVKGNSQALGASNFDTALTFIREYKTQANGGPDVEGTDEAYQAVRVKGTTVWIYLRETDKDSGELWADGDEIHLGGEVTSDTPMRVNNDGNIKRRIEFLPQDMISEQVVAPAVGG